MWDRFNQAYNLELSRETKRISQYVIYNTNMMIDRDTDRDKDTGAQKEGLIYGLYGSRGGQIRNLWVRLRPREDLQLQS